MVYIKKDSAMLGCSDSGWAAKLRHDMDKRRFWCRGDRSHGVKNRALQRKKIFSGESKLSEQVSRG